MIGAACLPLGQPGQEAHRQSAVRSKGRVTHRCLDLSDEQLECCGRNSPAAEEHAGHWKTATEQTGEYFRRLASSAAVIEFGRESFDHQHPLGPRAV
jgi:hypothetical protein